MKVNINNRAELNGLLENLLENAEAGWGLMKPQNMIEHLVKTLEFSNGKLLLEQKASDEEAKKARDLMVYTDMEMPKGIKSSTLGDVPDPFRFRTLGEAKTRLNAELDDFFSFFKENPDATFTHPRLGRMNYQEWVILHNKHFTHHFKQFGLL